MKLYILAFFLFFGPACEARKTQWGDKAFIVENLRAWSNEAVVRACVGQNQNSLFLFQRLNEYFLISHNGQVYDIAFIKSKNSPVEIEANGGLGRYIEIQKQFEILRRLLGNKIRQQDYATYVSTAPTVRCTF